MTIFILIVGNKIKAYSSLRRLCRETNNISFSFVKENLPFRQGDFRIEEVELDNKL